MMESERQRVNNKENYHRCLTLRVQDYDVLSNSAQAIAFWVRGWTSRILPAAGYCASAYVVGQEYRRVDDFNWHR